MNYNIGSLTGIVVSGVAYVSMDLNYKGIGAPHGAPIIFIL